MPRRLVPVVLAAVVAAVMTGCAPAASAPALPDGVEVGLIQLRSDVAAGEAQVRIVNGSDEPLEIGAVELVDPRFAEPAVRTDAGRVSTVRPGATVDVRVTLPAMACDTDEGDLTARLELAASGAVVEAPAADLLDIVAPLHERECRAARLADAAEVGFRAFHPSAAGEPATLDLAISPTGRAAAGLVEIRPTNLLMFPGMDAASAPLPLDVAVTEGDVDEQVVPVPIVPLRCDPHAVQEDKRGTVFTVELDLDGQPGEIELAAPEEMRAEILSWVTAWCAP